MDRDGGGLCSPERHLNCLRLLALEIIVLGGQQG